jgi:hypothetical protein
MFPYLVTEAHFLENGLLRKSVNITNYETFVNTNLSDKLRVGIGNGVFKTTDGESITWVSSELGLLNGNQWTFYNFRLFNSTDSQSLAVLNDTLTVVKSTIESNSSTYMWILK